MAGRSLSLPMSRQAVTVEGLAVRLALILLLILTTVVAVRPMLVPPAELTAVAPGEFSAQRAWADLETITAAPRAMGTPGLEAARTYLAHQFELLGLTPEVMDEVMIRQSAEAGAANLSRSHNIVARLSGTDSTGAILIGGHLDTVHTTTAAADCGSCAVGVLETARALAAGPPLRNDVIFLIDDGEETTRAGAFAFVERHPWAKDVRVAINQEAMGVAGASQLYVTGPQNGWTMRQALEALPNPVAYSLVNDLVWGTGTGGSHLDQYLLAAPVGVGFAFLGDVPPYHTMADNTDNLDPQTWQHQGDNVVSLVRHLGNVSLDGPLTAPDLVYYNLFDHVVVHYGAGTGIALALILAAGLIAVIVVGLRRQIFTWRGLAWGFGLLIPLTVLAMIIGGGIWYGLRNVDPRLQVFIIGVTYERPWYTAAFVLLSMGVVAGAYTLLKRPSALSLGMGALVWWVILALVTAFRVPGSSPVFTGPALFTLLPFVVLLVNPAARTSWLYPVVLAVAAAGSLLIVVPAFTFLGIFSGRAEVLMGLPMIALLPAPLAGLLAGLLLPVWGYLNGGQRGISSGLLIVSAAVIIAVLGFTASFTPEQPKPNMVAYVLDENDAYWVTLGANVGERRASLLDEWTSQFFAAGAEPTTFDPWGSGFVQVDYPAYRSPAPRVDMPAPEIDVVADNVDAQGVRHLQLAVTSPAAGPQRRFRIATTGVIMDAALQGQPLAEVVAPLPGTDEPSRRVLWVMVQGMTGETIQLDLAIQGNEPVSLDVQERLFSLPEVLDHPITPRPDWMMPSPTFVSDMTLATYSFTIE